MASTALEQIVTDLLLHLTGHYTFDDVVININSVRRLMTNPTSALVNGICTWWVYIIFCEFRTDNSELLQIIAEVITSVPAYNSSSHCCILKTLLIGDLKQVMGNDSCWWWPSPIARFHIKPFFVLFQREDCYLVLSTLYTNSDSLKSIFVVRKKPNTSTFVCTFDFC